MDCARFDDLLMTSLDGGLGEPEHVEYDLHLRTCAACVDKVRQSVLTLQILQGLRACEETEAPPPIAESLVQRILLARVAARAADGQQRTG